MRTTRHSAPTLAGITGQDQQAHDRSNLHHELVADLAVRAARWERLGDLQRAENLRRLARAAWEGATR